MCTSMISSSKIAHKRGAITDSAKERRQQIDQLGCRQIAGNREGRKKKIENGGDRTPLPTMDFKAINLPLWVLQI